MSREVGDSPCQWDVPVYWGTTTLGDGIVARWQRQGIVLGETPMLRDLAESVAQFIRDRVEDVPYLLLDGMVDVLVYDDCGNPEADIPKWKL